MARLTPYEHVFGEWAEEAFAGIRDAANRTRTDTSDRARFGALPAVQHLLGEIEAPEVIAAEPSAGPEYLHLLYAAYRHWVAGQPLIALDRTALEAAMRDAPRALQAPPLPATACYLQLPQHHLWAPLAAGQPHEPLDGAFVARRVDGLEYTIVAVLGLRPEREGFSQVTVTASPGDFAAAAVEVRQPLFAPVLAGGVAAGVRSVTSAAELLTLVGLALGSPRT